MTQYLVFRTPVVCKSTAVCCYRPQKYSVHESLPNADVEFPVLPRDRSIRVYSDVEQVQEWLTDPRFELVSSLDDADIVWTKLYLKDFKLVMTEFGSLFFAERSYVTFGLCHEPSVCSSVTLLHPRHRLELFGNIFASPNSAATRTFCVKIVGKNSKRFRGSCKLNTCKLAFFDQYVALYRKQYKIWP